jgi:hypothetical protein
MEKMKKILFISVVLFVFLAMAACAGVTPGGERIHKARGHVDTYEPGKTIKLKEGLDVQTYADSSFVTTTTGVYVFTIDPATKVTGDIKPGIRVLIRFTDQGSGPTSQNPKYALSIEAL